MAFSKIIAESMDLTDAYNFTGTLQQNGASIGGVNTPYFYALMSTSTGNPQSGVTKNVSTKMKFDDEIFDTASAYSTTDYRFTVPSGEAGKYFLFARGYSSRSNSVYNGSISIKLNGGSRVNQIGNQIDFYGGAQAGSTNTCHCAGLVNLSVGDYVEAFWYGSHGTGNNVDIYYYNACFGGYKIIE